MKRARWSNSYEGRVWYTLAPPGSVDVNVDVLVALVVELGVVVVPKVESRLLLY